MLIVQTFLPNSSEILLSLTTVIELITVYDLFVFAQSSLTAKLLFG